LYGHILQGRGSLDGSQSAQPNCRKRDRSQADRNDNPEQRRLFFDTPQGKRYENHREAVKREHDSADRPISRVEEIVEVGTISAEWRGAVPQAANHGENSVKKRKSRDQRWKQQHRAGRGAGAVEIKAQEREGETDRDAARIAHKCSRGRRIVEKKSHASAYKARSHDDREWTRQGIGQRDIRGTNDPDHSGGDSVHSIEQVYGVGHHGNER
jgi:hypothetical protein